MKVCDETPDSNGMLLSPACREVRVARAKVANKRLNGITNAIAANTSRAAQSPSTEGDYSTAHKLRSRRAAIRMFSPIRVGWRVSQAPLEKSVTRLLIVTSEQIGGRTIIGGGPTGLAAAYYGGHRAARVRIGESLEQLGGQA